MKDLWNHLLEQIQKGKDRLTGLSADVSGLADLAKPFLVVCAVTLISFLSIDIFYKVIALWMPSGIATSAVSVSVPAASRVKPSPERYAGITHRNLFQTTLKAIEDKNAAGLNIPSEEYTDFELKGTIAVDASTGFAIVEEKGKGKQKLYRIGEMIGSARLVRVGRNMAILNSGGRDLVMKIKEPAQGPAARQSPGGPSRGITVSREEVTQSLGDLKSIMSQAVVRPFLAEGVQQGFVISNIVPGSLYQRLGLQNGDVITEVNNAKLEGADDILQLVTKMQAGGNVSVGLTRNGESQTLTYSFQ